MTKINKGISIVISVFKQEKELNNLLQQILFNKTNYNGNYEIIIVADGEQVKINSPLNLENVHYFKREKNFGSVLSRHFGVLKSKFDIIYCHVCIAASTSAWFFPVMSIFVHDTAL